jgi:hypothetical protein
VKEQANGYCDNKVKRIEQTLSLSPVPSAQAKYPNNGRLHSFFRSNQINTLSILYQQDSVISYFYHLAYLAKFTEHNSSSSIPDEKNNAGEKLPRSDCVLY